jgi:hypothetical protein
MPPPTSSRAVEGGSSPHAASPRHLALISFGILHLLRCHENIHKGEHLVACHEIEEVEDLGCRREVAWPNLLLVAAVPSFLVAGPFLLVLAAAVAVAVAVVVVVVLPSSSSCWVT